MDFLLDAYGQAGNEILYRQADPQNRLGEKVSRIYPSIGNDESLS
jgi:hypothetical protein